jgi:hypothetical protein
MSTLLHDRGPDGGSNRTHGGATMVLKPAPRLIWNPPTARWLGYKACEPANRLNISDLVVAFPPRS